MIHQTAVKGRQLSVVACTLALSVAIPWPKASAEATNTTPSKTPPSYIEADRSDADQVLGSALTNNVFSDRFTALRKELVPRRSAAIRLRDARSRRSSRSRSCHRKSRPQKGRRERRPTPSAARSVCAERFCCSSL